MVYTGQMKDGAVVFDNGKPPEGAKVRIEVVEQPPTRETQASPAGAWAVLLKYAGTVEGLPEDFAKNHDHYIHGTPKKS